jgi:hypothetical protein
VVVVSGSSVVTSTPSKLIELTVVDDNAPPIDALADSVDTPAGSRSLLAVPGRVGGGAPLITLNACVLTGRSSRASDGVVLVVSTAASPLTFRDGFANSRSFIAAASSELGPAGPFVVTTLFVDGTCVLLVVVDGRLMLLLPLLLLLPDADDNDDGDAPVNPVRPDSFDLPPTLLFVDDFAVVALLTVWPNDDDGDNSSGVPKRVESPALG